MGRRQVMAAGAFVFDQTGRVFLAKFASKFDQRWSIPGGKIEFGELPLDAVKREVKEETNLDITAVEYFKHGAFTVNDCHVIYIDYIAMCRRAGKVKLNDEFSEWGFFTWGELDALDMIPETKQMVFEAIAHRWRQDFVVKLSECQIGLIRKTVSLQDHQENWAKAFAWVRAKLLGVLDEARHYDIQHIGSTSIPGLVAKPVIDILVTFTDRERFLADIGKIESLGFIYRGDAISEAGFADFDKEQHFFVFYNNEQNIAYAHLHALPSEHCAAHDLLRFRDRLRAMPALRSEYQELKTQVCSQGTGRRSYTSAKGSFVARILAEN